METQTLDISTQAETDNTNGVTPKPLRRGIRFASVKDIQKIATIVYQDTAFDAAYLPGKVTPRAMREFDDNTDNIDKITDMLSQFVSTWDVLDDEGERLPATKEVMLDFPLSFLNAILTAIIEDMNPSPPSGGASSLS
ncbi:MAG: hypothetical protein M3440_09550 [Chloroflexota bacterium]|nr:hypothetical protein [Chloroflexota bacterium]